MKFNQAFLDEMGLGNISDENKQAFLEYLRSELELRIGRTLSEMMTSEQLVEFKKIVDKDTGFMLNWLSAFVPMYQSDDRFIAIQEAGNYDIADPKLLEEYTSAKWLELNQPDYAQTVAEEIRKLRKELLDNKEEIAKSFQD